MNGSTGLERGSHAPGLSGRFAEYDALEAVDSGAIGGSWDGELGRGGLRRRGGVRRPRVTRRGFRRRRPVARRPSRIRSRPLRARPARTPRRFGRRPRPRRRPFRRPRRRVIVVRQRAVAPPPPEQGTEYMRWVQNALNRILGRQLLVNGIAGPATRAAIREFQSREGLPVSGFAGPKTEQALTAALTEKQPQPAADGAGGDPPPEESAAELELLEGEWQREVDRRSRLYIRWVQQGLNKVLGLRLAEDGIMGPKTRSAVRSFQQRYRLAVDGVVGPQTERALIAASAGNPPVSGAST
ncbi:MAG: peptidoglycan-binding protein, partial [Anaerolineae bacterium]|nr:peptidoglycan-binding protein [Anaerolineae bacterium]